MRWLPLVLILAAPASSGAQAAPLSRGARRHRARLLIQLRARLPAALVARFAGARPVQACILLTTATDRVPVLVDLLPDASGSQWYAAANMLLEDKAPGLAAHLLRTVRLQLTITVSEGGNRMSGASGAFGAWGVLLERVAELRRDLERRFRSVHMRIEQVFEVPADSTPVPIEVQLVDARKDRSVPLPPIPH